MLPDCQAWPQHDGQPAERDMASAHVTEQCNTCPLHFQVAYASTLLKWPQHHAQPAETTSAAESSYGVAAQAHCTDVSIWPATISASTTSTSHAQSEKTHNLMAVCHKQQCTQCVQCRKRYAILRCCRLAHTVWILVTLLCSEQSCTSTAHPELHWVRVMLMAL